MFLNENDLPLDGVQVPVQGPEAGPGTGGVGPTAGHHFVKPNQYSQILRWQCCSVVDNGKYTAMCSLCHVLLKVF